MAGCQWGTRLASLAPSGPGLPAIDRICYASPPCWTAPVVGSLLDAEARPPMTTGPSLVEVSRDPRSRLRIVALAAVLALVPRSRSRSQRPALPRWQARTTASVKPSDRRGLLRRRRAAPGPRQEVRGPGRDADDARLPPERRLGAGNGLLTQAPPNTGAGWYTLATGAWPGVHGSTNNTFHVNGQPFGNRTSAFDPGRPAGRVDRPVGRARRAQGRPGRVGRRPQRHHPGPDHRLPVVPLRPRRGDELHRRRPATPLFDDAAFISAVRPPVRPPGRLRRPGAVPRRRADAGDRLDRRPAGSRSAPPKEMRLRVLDFGVDKYGLNAYIFDSTDDATHELRPGPVLPDEGRRRRRRHARARASGPTSR